MPETFYLVWLDDDKDQGPKHATFKISKDGEMLRLSEGPSTGFALVDSISFGLQETNISWGRELDGGPIWVAFPAPTPEYSNLLTAMEELAGTGRRPAHSSQPGHCRLLLFQQSGLRSYLQHDGTKDDGAKRHGIRSNPMPESGSLHLQIGAGRNCAVYSDSISS